MNSTDIIISNLVTSLRSDRDFDGSETVEFVRECYEISELSDEETQRSIDEAAASIDR